MNKKTKKTITGKEEFPLAPHYDKKDDIYNKEKEVPLKEERPGNTDLDIPGAELDDADEATGNEDEENNYYSLGGDNHNDLEEEKE